MTIEDAETECWSVSTHIHIPASPAQVWAVLTEFGAYPQWNPLVRSISGPLHVGARLDALIAPPGSKPMRFRPKLLAVEMNRELRWRGHVLVPGLVDGEHLFRLEPDGQGGTNFDHREKFSGLLARLVFGKAATARVGAGFQAMNAALRTRTLAGLA